MSASGDRARPTSAPRIEFVENDLPRALALAKQRGQPAVFVDAWAPWCHTCLSMQHYVFVDATVVALQDRVTFAALDTDRPENAAFVENADIGTWPTFFVLDAQSGETVDTWAGAASASELASFVKGALDAILASRTESLRPGSAEYHFALGKRAELERRADAAAREYGLALEKATPAFARRSEALLGRLQALAAGKRWRACTEVGERHLSSVEGSSRPADFASFYLSCASQVPDRKRHAELVRRRLEELAAAPPREASADDRGDALRILAETCRMLGDGEGAREARIRQIALLEAAAESAPSPTAAQTFDAARANAYLELGHAERAITMLEDRERQLPTSYEPPSRLASVLGHLGRHEDALAAVERALTRSYGMALPRLLARKAEILRTLGRHDEHIEALRAEVGVYERAPATRLNQRRLDEARGRLTRAEREGR